MNKAIFWDLQGTLGGNATENIEQFLPYVFSKDALRISKEKGFLKGLLLGITYYLLSYLVFSFLQGSFALHLSNLYDFLLTSIMSGIIGMIVVNIGK